MSETIDLRTLRSAKRELKAFTNETGQPTALEQLDLEPIRQVQKIEITEEFVTVTFNERITMRYNVKEITQKEWEYKYNDDPEFVAAIGAVIDLARAHLRDLPENLACPPGCAQCCSGYEPFVSHEDIDRIAEHFNMSTHEVTKRYVVKRASADGYIVGYLRKVTDDVADKCIFLKGRSSGRYYCGIYAARPHDCRAFSPIGCTDVDDNLPRTGSYPVGRPFRPRHS